MPLPAVLCFSHVRWAAAHERPNHLMQRCARRHRVFFIEEPVIDVTYTEITKLAPNLWRVVPHLSESKSEAELLTLWQGQLGLLRAEHRIDRPILWYYTPGAIPITRQLARSLTVYDCMHDLSGHEQNVPELCAWERELMRVADVVFVGGRALYEGKRHLHGNVHTMPSSIDVEFFAQARIPSVIPGDQSDIPGPRVGYYGALDERMDWELLEELADLRPDWHHVLLGPAAGRAERLIPQRANVHYLGAKPYDQLPSYLADWDVAMVPFLVNDATTCLSPNKILAYLAAGKPVVSSPLPDVIEPYGHLGLVRVAKDARGFVGAIEAELRGEHVSTPEQRDAFLAHATWDGTWQRMYDLMLDAWVGQMDSAFGQVSRSGVQSARH